MTYNGASVAPLQSLPLISAPLVDGVTLPITILIFLNLCFSKLPNTELVLCLQFTEGNSEILCFLYPSRYLHIVLYAVCEGVCIIQTTNKNNIELFSRNSQKYFQSCIQTDSRNNMTKCCQITYIQVYKQCTCANVLNLYKHNYF